EMTESKEAQDRRWIALILLCIAQFVVVLDASIVNVALPTIGNALGFSESNLPWVVNAYVLTFGGFLLLGGRMADLLGRRRVFMVGLVVFALASLAGGLATNSGQLIAARAVMLLEESRSEGIGRHFDFAGALTITGGLSVLVYALVDAGNAGWGSARTIGLLALSAVLLIAFVVTELRAVAPLVPFKIFRQRTLTGANVVGVLVGASLFSMFFFISLYMQQVLGYSPIHAGLSYLPLAVSIIVSAGIASQLTTKVGFKSVLVAGMA